MSNRSTFLEISVRECERGGHHPEKERGENPWQQIVPFSEDKPVRFLKDKVLFSQVFTVNGILLNINNYGSTEIFVGEKPIIERDYKGGAFNLAPSIIGWFKDYEQEHKPKKAYILFREPEKEITLTFKTNKVPVKEVKVVSKFNTNIFWFGNDCYN